MAKVAVAQMSSGTNININLEKITQLVAKAAKHEAKLILLPENCICFVKGSRASIAENFKDGPIQAKLSQLALKYAIWIVVGSILIKNDSARPNSCTLVFNDLGEIIARYDKIHLFDASVGDFEHYHESQDIAPGNSIIVIDSPVGKIGLSICYDLRFPKLYNLMSQLGAEVFCIPAAFTYSTGRVHWDTLIKARAIENLSYVLAANQVGQNTPKRRTYGHSSIIGPWGELLAHNASDETVIFAEIDLGILREYRKKFPTLQHHVLG